MDVSGLFQTSVLVPWLLSMVAGIVVGATPGMTATMAVALIVPISFYMPDPMAGLAMIIGVSFTAIFAGDIPATFLRIPGTPASAAATIDGHEMAKQGRGRFALLLDLYCSSLGGLIGVTALIFAAPWIAGHALKFSHFEYFWLAVFGLSMSAVVSAGRTVKGLLSACLGILLSTVGMDIASGTPRFAFGNADLMSGIGFIPVMIGLFGISEVLRNVKENVSMAQAAIPEEAEGGSAREALKSIWKHKGTVVQSSLLGTVVGALPGAGADVAAWGAYGVAKKTSRDPDSFGKGSEEGVIAPTSANNAAVGGAWIPALVFGVPGDAVTAIVLGAFMMYDITPGPGIFSGENARISTIFAVALATQVLLLPAGWVGIKVFRWILELPRSIVMTAVVVFSVVGSYSLRNSMFDVYTMMAAGILGFFLDARRVPLAPLILGLILGPMAERELRAGLISSQGDLWPMVTRPISLTIVILLVLLFALPKLLAMRKVKAE